MSAKNTKISEDGDTAQKMTDEVKAPQEKTAKGKSVGRNTHSAHETACIALAKKYFKNYPGEKVLHITRDMQVFLSHNRGLALSHQRTLPEGAVVSVDATGKIVNL